MAKITNVRSLTLKLGAIGKETGKLVGRAVKRGGLAIENRAVEGIMGPPATGRIYRRGKKLHQASAPGEFPAADTGRLHQSITSAMPINGPDRYMSVTGSNVPYDKHLEFGTSKMAPRPFMGPSFDEVKPQVEESIRKAVLKGARSGAKSK